MTWTTIVHDVPAEQREALLEYCRTAEAKDKTFQMQVLEDRVIIKSPTRDQSYRRGQIMHYRFKAYYEVVYERE